MPLGMEAGLGPGHIVLDGDPAPQKRRSTPSFQSCLWWPNGWMSQDATLYGGRPWPRRQCVRWGPSSPSKRHSSHALFGPCLLWPNGWMDQDTTWYGGRPLPRPYCVKWEPSSPCGKGYSTHPTPVFGPCLVWPNGRPSQRYCSFTELARTFIRRRTAELYKKSISPTQAAKRKHRHNLLNGKFLSIRHFCSKVFTLSC